MIYLYEDTRATYFSGAVRIPIFPIGCIAHGELNGNLSVELTTSDDSQKIELEQIITVPLPSYSNNQAFRTNKSEKSLSAKTITYKGKHIFYDLEDNFIIDKRPTDASPQQALERFLEGLSYSTPFSIGEVFTGSNNTAYWEYKNPVEALLGTDDNSFINRWGGEFKRDNHTINCYDRLSQTTKEKQNIIFVGREVLDMNITISVENTVTRIIPTGLNSDNSIVKLPEIYVDSSHINDYSYPKIRRIHYSDIKQGTDEYPEGSAGAQAMYAEMRRRAQAEFAKGIDLPQISGQINIVELAKTVEYEKYAELFKVLPYDDFIVVDSDGKRYSARLTAFDYDCIAEQYINLHIGNVNTVSNFEKLIKAIK